MSSPLQELSEQLINISSEQTNISYRLPSVWLNPFNKNGVTVVNNPSKLLLDIVSDIRFASVPRYKTVLPIPLSETTIYSMSIRHTTAFDHDGDGELAPIINKQGWRETGTFIKGIMILPYLQAMGIRTIHLLPISSIGTYNKKGNEGSVFATAVHSAIDPSLAEPMFKLPLEKQCAAFMEAIARLGMNVICEFPLRTVSIDSPLAIEHPDWFYWIKVENDNKQFKPPTFSQDELAIIDLAMNTGDRTNLPIPSEEYRKQFCKTPVKVWKSSIGKIVGSLDDGTLVTLPSAFADYPPNDNQPLWSDVTYLKLHTHPDYNYIAYNTVRMYDNELTTGKYDNHALIQYLSEIIPSFVKQYKIHGAVIDMSHALPINIRKKILTLARKSRKDFVLIEENFTATEESASAGFDGVVGSSWLYARNTQQWKEYIKNDAMNETSLPELGALGTHNTPRISAYIDSSTHCAMLDELWFNPLKIPFILSGDEIGEKTPMNTGLGFSDVELSQYQSEELPLFSRSTISWETADIERLKGISSIIKSVSSQRTS
jgi:starch synthase (maltosyl-transferring)